MTWDKDKVVRYEEKECAVGIVVQGKKMDNLVMMMNVKQILVLVEDKICGSYWEGRNKDAVICEQPLMVMILIPTVPK